MSIRQASKVFGIPYSTLHDKINNKTPLETKMGRTSLLTEAEETLVVKSIMDLQCRELPVTKEKLIASITDILRSERKDGLQRNIPFGQIAEGYKPGKEWLRQFLLRHPEITLSPEVTSISHKNNYKASAKNWFSKVEKHFEEGKDAECVGTESGFSVSPVKGEVIAAISSRNDVSVTSGQIKENMTVLGKYLS